MRSTHACTPTFALFPSQYSRRLLSILAQPTSSIKLPKHVSLTHSHEINLVMWCTPSLLKKAKHKKKCGAHTHVHHLHATFFVNIHVSCCLFSHIYDNKHKKKQFGCFVVIARISLCLLRWVIILLTNLIKERSEKKKCGAHTHAHHLSQLSNPIFTSVVVYSRTKQQHQQKIITRDC